MLAAEQLQLLLRSLGGGGLLCDLGPFRHSHNPEAAPVNSAGEALRVQNLGKYERQAWQTGGVPVDKVAMMLLNNNVNAKLPTDNSFSTSTAPLLLLGTLGCTE